MARVYIGTRMLGGGVILGKEEMTVVLERFKSYGKQAGEAIDTTLKNRVEPPPHGGARRH